MVVTWNPQLEARVIDATFRGVVMGTEMVLTEGNRLQRESPRTGRTYVRRGVAHKASAPGEPPAPDTSRLIQSSRAEFDRALLSGTAIWSTEYALPLEVGTNKMEPRPYARPALSNMEAAIIAAIKGQIKSVLP